MDSKKSLVKIARSLQRKADCIKKKDRNNLAWKRYQDEADYFIQKAEESK